MEEFISKEEARENAQQLVNDIVLLALKARDAIDVGQYTGETADKAYEALTLCDLVLNTWTKK